MGKRCTDCCWDEFNYFFTEIDSKISNSIQPTITQLENYLTDLPNIRQLDLGQTGHVHFCDILKSFEPKKSQDIDGISIELLKFISTAISTPLSHILYLIWASARAFFQVNLKLLVQYQSSKLAVLTSVITIAPFRFWAHYQKFSKKSSPYNLLITSNSTN